MAEDKIDISPTHVESPDERANDPGPAEGFPDSIVDSVQGRPVPTEALSDHDKKVMRRLLWKIDLTILPILSIIYLLATMARVDIGNAQVAGMQKQLRINDTNWANLNSFFYIGYILSHPVGTLSLRKFTPPYTIGGGIIAWGALTVCLVAVNSFAQAVGVRVLVGVAEGWIHAASLYLSLWYNPRELATRGSIYFSTSSLAGAFSGLIAYGIVTDLSHTAPYQPWQWLFLVEGLMSVGFGIIVVFILPPVPEKVKWGFTPDERRMAVIRTWQANNTPGAKVIWRQLLVPFTWPTLYVWIVLYACTQIAVTSLSAFLPTIVKGMGYSHVQAQLMTVPVYACAFVSTIFFGWLSDVTQKRAFWIIACSLGSLIGYIMLLVDTGNNRVRYAGICIAAIGQYPLLPIVNVWTAVNSRAFSERATAGIMIAMIGQAAASSALTGFNTPPYYIKGLWIVFGCVCLMPPVAAFGWWYVVKENRRKREMMHNPAVNELRKKGLEELGSAHPDFVYSI